MGTKDTRAANGAEKKKDILLFDPDHLVLVEDEGSPLYDERVKLPVSESMVLNMLALGVLEPIIVCKNTETGKTEVVAGRQRVKACREANRRLRKQGAEPLLIPGTVRRAEPSTLASIVLSENEIREGDSPLARARKVQRLLDLGRTEEDVAIVIGQSVTTVKNLVRLLDAPAAVRRAVDKGEITASAGYALARLEPDEAKAKLDKLAAEAPRAGAKRSSNGAAARKIVGSGSTVRGKRELSAELARVEGLPGDRANGYTQALRWVMGEEGAEAL